MNLEAVDRRGISVLAEDDLTQVGGGYWTVAVVAAAIIGDAANNFIDGASDAIADNLDDSSEGGG
ncbi:MAG: hypothetical protein ACNS61_00290 [Candidatus Wenzhouxiangella sp. M2_3B_020]